MSTVPATPTPPVFASAAEAQAMVRAGLVYLAAADPTAMPAQAQADQLRALEQNEAISTAVRAKILAAFTAGRGYAADADYSPTSWLIHQTRVTKGAARAHRAWARRAGAHPVVVAALAEGIVLTESMARAVCGWVDQIPADCRDAADAILVAAARAGARQQDLAELAAEIYARSRRDAPDGDPGRAFEDRRVVLETTFGGAGVLNGDLTPECAAVVTAVLESLAAPRGAEVSGPGGLASFLRRHQLGARLAGPSLPLDVGRSPDIPAAIRRAVILRDQHCRWAGGCDQPAAACEVHHVTHLADGGTTSVHDCALYCWFHHHVAIHQWGWTVALHPDGTTTARSPDGTKILHSHGPPARPG